MTTIDPALAHNNNILAVEEKYAGKPLYAPQPPNAPAPIKADETPGATPQPAPQPVVTPDPAPAQAGDGGSPTPTPAPVAKQDRLAKSLAIQRRAQESMRRAKAEASKLRQPKEAPKPEEPPKVEADQAAQARVTQMQAELEAEVRLAKTDPLAFAKRHGVSGADIANYIRTGADPNARAIDLLRQDTAKAIAQIRQEVKAEYDQKLEAITSTIIQDRETQAQTNFFTFVEEAKDQNPDAFKAIGSGLLYTEAELWNRANEVLASRPDLQKDFDEDKLLEAVETEARKDPRWSRIEPLLQSQSQQKPNVEPKSEKSNASANVEPPAAKQPEPVQRTSQPRERDPQSGKFVEQRRSPFEDHTKHVDGVVNRVLGRFGG